MSLTCQQMNAAQRASALAANIDNPQRRHDASAKIGHCRLCGAVLPVAVRAIKIGDPAQCVEIPPHDHQRLAKLDAVASSDDAGFSTGWIACMVRVCAVSGTEALWHEARAINRQREIDRLKTIQQATRPETTRRRQPQWVGA